MEYLSIPYGEYTIMMYSGPWGKYSTTRVSQQIILLGFYGGMGVEGRASNSTLTAVAELCKTIVAALLDLKCCIPAFGLCQMAWRLEWIMDLNVDQPLNRDMMQALTNAQKLSCPRQWFMKRLCKTTTSTKKHTLTPFLLLRF